MLNNNQGVLLYNVFVEENEDNKYRLNVEELYLWSVLQRLKNYNHETITSVNFIDDYSRKYGVYFYGNKTESRKLINKCLVSLQEKCLITIDEELDNDKQLFRITFTTLESGFEYIPFFTFDSISVMEHLYIHFTILKWKGTKRGTFNCSNSRWEKILGASENTVKKYIKQCEEQGLLYRVMGDYTNNEARFGQSKQDEYKYKTTPFKEEEKSNIQRKKEREGSTGELYDIERFQNNEYSFPTGNWLNSNNLDVDDYVIYLKHKGINNPTSKDFIADCDKKRRRIMKGNSKFKYFDDKYMEEAKQQVIDNLEEKYLMQANEILNNTNDVALLVNGYVLSYDEWNKQDKVERVYYRFGKFVSEVDDFIDETYHQNIVSNEEVDYHRPDENGEWDDENKRNDREMKLQLEMEEWY